MAVVCSRCPRLRLRLCPLRPLRPRCPIQGPKDHGMRGLVNLFGIESPGLTSALALAEAVVMELGVEPAAS